MDGTIQCDDIKQVMHDLYGNGKTGYAKRVDEHETFIQRLVGMGRVTLLLVALNTMITVGALLFRLVKP